MNISIRFWHCLFVESINLYSFEFNVTERKSIYILFFVIPLVIDIYVVSLKSDANFYFNHLH